MSARTSGRLVLRLALRLVVRLVVVDHALHAVVDRVEVPSPMQSLTRRSAAVAQYKKWQKKKYKEEHKRKK